MSGLNYKYRQNLIANACTIQKQNTHSVMNQCCFCNSCNGELHSFMERLKNNTVRETTYTIEPSDLQQNYTSRFNTLANKASVSYTLNK